MTVATAFLIFGAVFVATEAFRIYRGGRHR
jgi:hypothetical protein